MATPSHDQQPAIFDKEILRFTFCGIVIASFFAALTAGTSLRDLLSPYGSQVATTVLGLAAALSFAYLLSVASWLKYKSPRKVDRFTLSAKVTRFFYDMTVNVFGIYVLVLLSQFVITRWLHLGFLWYLLPLYVVVSSGLYVVARFGWFLVRGLIEYYYDEIAS
ncbi:MAG TPA: hypothetical protein VLI05_04340 [Candidatus Saccharimonadia bacterium]|nr:hypothetical protein [Candidatus Saccharimonadia bacterium]